MAEVEHLVRGVTKDGLLWGACEFQRYAHTCAVYARISFPPAKLVPVAYGVMKLQISCVIEDEKVGTDFLEESITAFEDYVSVVLFPCQCSNFLLYILPSGSKCGYCSLQQDLNSCLCVFVYMSV